LERSVIALLLLATFGPASPVSLEVRLVVPCSGPHYAQPAKDPSGAGEICLDKSAFLTTADVESAEVRHNSAGHDTVFLTFHHDAAVRELQVTLRNIGHRVAILIDGRVAAAPIISSGSRFLFVDGNFTHARAEEIAGSLNSQARK
jgi:preprotein translocase subunit SecD